MSDLFPSFLLYKDNREAMRFADSDISLIFPDDVCLSVCFVLFCSAPLLLSHLGS